MNLGEKLQNLIDEYQDGDKVKVYSTCSLDRHKKVEEWYWGSHHALVQSLKESLNDFNKYGECAGSDSK